MANWTQWLSGFAEHWRLDTTSGETYGFPASRASIFDVLRATVIFYRAFISHMKPLIREIVMGTSSLSRIASSFTMGSSADLRDRSDEGIFTSKAAISDRSWLVFWWSGTKNGITWIEHLKSTPLDRRRKPVAYRQEEWGGASTNNFPLRTTICWSRIQMKNMFLSKRVKNHFSTLLSGLDSIYFRFLGSIGS